MAETWVINEAVILMSIDQEINFVSNNIAYRAFGINFNAIVYTPIGPTPTLVYGPADPLDPMLPPVWRDGNGNPTTYELTPYKTVTFETAPTGSLLTWLQANAVKQQSNITLDLSTIGLPVGTHSIQIKLSDDGLTKRDSELSNAVTYIQPDPLPQLDTPTNVSVSGTTAECDEVENAESYEYFVDGVSIGECEVPRGYTVALSFASYLSESANTYTYIKINGQASQTDYDYIFYGVFEFTLYDKSGNVLIEDWSGDASYTLPDKVNTISFYTTSGALYDGGTDISNSTLTITENTTLSLTWETDD